MGLEERPMGALPMEWLWAEPVEGGRREEKSDMLGRPQGCLWVLKV